MAPHGRTLAPRASEPAGPLGEASGAVAPARKHGAVARSATAGTRGSEGLVTAGPS